MRRSPSPTRIIGTDAPLVGRGKELERILSAVDRARAGGGLQFVFLTGEPGVGKTRLARESLGRARSRGVLVYTGRCFEQHTAVPFFPFTEPFAAALEHASPDIHAELRSRWPELGYIIPDLGRPPASGEGQETQLQVFRAAAALVQALAAATPFVLLLDDLQWADSTSLGLLLYLGRHLNDTPLLIVGTCRDAEIGRNQPLEITLRELIRERRLDEIHLSRLSLAETTELVRSRVGPLATAHELSALIHQRAQGNPFFTEELVAAYVENSAGPEAESVSPAAPQLVHIPHSIRLVVGERVGRLPAEAQDLLRLASIVGEEFDLNVLRAAGDRSQAELDTGLEAALEARLLEESRGGQGERFAFNHALIQQTLYEEIPAHRRRRLHLQIGEALEKAKAGHAAANAELAWHFRQGGEAARAAVYASRAGDDAARRYAHAEAAHHYASAVAVLTESGETAQATELQCQLAAELFDLNRVPESVATYETALAAFAKRHDQRGQALAHWGLGRVHSGRYDFDAAIGHLDAALRLWPVESEDAELARLLVDTVRAKVFGGAAAAAIHLADRAVTLAERLGDGALIARALVGLIEAHEGDRESVKIPTLERAETLARAANDWRTLCRIYVARAVDHVNLGELDKGIADNRSAIEAAYRSGETERLRFAYQALSLHLSWQGSWEDARAAARAGLALDPQSRFHGVAGEAVLAWTEGRYEDALRLYQAFASDGRERQDVQAITYGRALFADSLLQLDRFADAEEPAREAAEVTMSTWPSMASFVAPLAETLARLHGPDAETTLSDAERVIEETGKAVARPQLLRARGVLLMQNGDFAAAIETLHASAQVARSQNALIQLGRTLATLADAARQQGDQPMAEQADAERAALVERIGPEVRGLSWARHLPFSRHRPARHDRTGPLSPREREVALLVADGLSDRQIADRLVITEGTAGVHVTHILTKLGFHSRAAIAKWVAERGFSSTSEQ